MKRIVFLFTSLVLFLFSSTYSFAGNTVTKCAGETLVISWSSISCSPAPVISTVSGFGCTVDTAGNLSGSGSATAPSTAGSSCSAQISCTGATPDQATVNAVACSCSGSYGAGTPCADTTPVVGDGLTSTPSWTAVASCSGAAKCSYIAAAPSYSCLGTAPTGGNFISNAVATADGQTWTNDGVGSAACTWKCDTGYSQSGNTCVLTPVHCVASWVQDSSPTCSVSGACGQTGKYSRTFTMTTAPANGGNSCATVYPSTAIGATDNNGGTCSTAECPTCPVWDSTLSPTDTGTLCTYTGSVGITAIGGTYDVPVTLPSGYSGQVPFTCTNVSGVGTWSAGTPVCTPPAPTDCAAATDYSGNCTYPAAVMTTGQTGYVVSHNKNADGGASYSGSATYSCTNTVRTRTSVSCTLDPFTCGAGDSITNAGSCNVAANAGGQTNNLISSVCGSTPCSYRCNAGWHINAGGTACEEDTYSCATVDPPNNGTSNSTGATSASQAWTYNTTGGACTYHCAGTYSSWNTSACVAPSVSDCTASQTKTWGVGCSATTVSTAHGGSAGLTNTASSYTGTATFSCDGTTNTYTYSSGSCSASAEPSGSSCPTYCGYEGRDATASTGIWNYTSYTSDNVHHSTPVSGNPLFTSFGPGDNPTPPTSATDWYRQDQELYFSSTNDYVTLSVLYTISNYVAGQSSCPATDECPGTWSQASCPARACGQSAQTIEATCSNSSCVLGDKPSDRSCPSSSACPSVSLSVGGKTSNYSISNFDTTQPMVWSSTNALGSSCSGGGDWRSDPGASGSGNTGTLTNNSPDTPRVYQYPYSCYNSDYPAAYAGYASKQIDVTVCPSGTPVWNGSSCQGLPDAGLSWVTGNYTSLGQMRLSCTNSSFYTFKRDGATVEDGSTGGNSFAKNVSVTIAGTYSLVCEYLAEDGYNPKAYNAVDLEYETTPPDPIVSITASPISITKGSVSVLSWTVMFPNSVQEPARSACTITAFPVCTGKCTDAQLQASSTVNAILKTKKTDTNDPSGSRSISSAINELVRPISSDDWRAMGKKGINLDKSMDFKLNCGAGLRASSTVRVIVTSTNEG